MFTDVGTETSRNSVTSKVSSHKNQKSVKKKILLQVLWLLKTPVKSPYNSN